VPDSELDKKWSSALEVSLRSALLCEPGAQQRDAAMLDLSRQLLNEAAAKIATTVGQIAAG
jgi:hypothetical protein